MAKAKAKDEKASGRQSGGYPYNPFTPSCLKLAKVVSDAGGDVPKALIARELSMDEGSSAFAQLVASSKCYGIVDGLRSLSLTDAGHEYFYPTTETGARAAMLSFFSNPPAFKFLIGKFDGGKLPAGTLMANLLHRQQGVPPSWAGRAVAFFLGLASELGLIDERGFLRYAAAMHSAQRQGMNTHPGPSTAAEAPDGATTLAAQSAAAVTEPTARPTLFPNRSRLNVWTYNEAGGTIKLETTDPLPRALWERLKRYVDILEPADPAPETPEARMRRVEEQLKEL